MATPSASASAPTSQPPQYRPVGVVLAIGSGLLIGSSFVFKKKGLLSSQKGHIAGEGVAYLKSPMWWTGMIIMILGELCNFAAYAFVEAIIVTPMGALSVVISALLSHVFLNERLSLFGWISCIQCLLGASILALNGPQEQSVNTIIAFRKLFVTPWFLAYGGVVIAIAVVLAVYVSPRWGKQSMLPYLGVCSLIGGLSVSCTQGLGACILTSIRGDNQFKNWFIYFLLIFVIITLLTEIYYLNVALALFNTAMVTPTYYVTFTFCTLVTSVILYQGLKASATQIITIVLAFAVICTGIFILQMSKVDPRKLANVDERTTLLLEAARQEVDPYAARSLELHRTGTLRSLRSRHSRPSNVQADAQTPGQSATLNHTHMDNALDLNGSSNPNDEEEEDILDDLDIDDTHAIVEKTEEPGLDSLRGAAGAIGTIIRARRRARQLSAVSASRSRLSGDNASIPSQDAFRSRSRSISSRGSGVPGVGAGNRPTPGWLRGMWTSTPRASRFTTSPNGNLDLEKSPVEVEEVEVEGGSEDIIAGRAVETSGLVTETRNGTVSSRYPLPLPPSIPPTLRNTTPETLVRGGSAVHFVEGSISQSAPAVPGALHVDGLDP